MLQGGTGGAPLFTSMERKRTCARLFRWRAWLLQWRCWVWGPTGSCNRVSTMGGHNITVRDGTMRGMAAAGISLLSGAGTVAPPSLVEKMSLHSNGTSGMLLDTGLVLNNVTGTNGVWGIA